MNKKIPTTIFILFCVLALFFAAKAFLPKEKIALDQANKTFVVKGDVKIKKAKTQAGWQKMETSTVLEKGDIVETATDSTVDIVIGEGGGKSVKVEAKSQVEFQDINPTYLNCPRGKILVAIKKLEPKSSFVVKTPTAICGARGTAWLEEASENKTKVCVFENQVYLQEIGPSGRPKMKKHIADEGTQRTLLKDEPVSYTQKIEENDLRNWQYWNKNITFLREGKILINDFNRKENFNNLGGDFGSWNVFYSDTNQYCRDELTDLEKVGDEGYSLKLTYDVDTPFSAYNGFFIRLMDIDISDYKYLVFFIKGDGNTGFTTRVNIELKNKNQIGRYTLEGITDEWKKIVIPLDQFIGIGELKEMREVVIVFSDNSVTKKEGVIYIDDIYLAKTE